MSEQYYSKDSVRWPMAFAAASFFISIALIFSSIAWANSWNEVQLERLKYECQETHNISE